MSLNIALNDDQNTFNFHVDLRDHLVDAGQFGLPKGSFCYVPVFQSVEEEEDDDIWHIGASFLNDHVLVFDNTHYTERNQTYQTIGIGKKDAQNVETEIKKYYQAKEKSELDQSKVSTLHKAVVIEKSNKDVVTGWDSQLAALTKNYQIILYSVSHESKRDSRLATLKKSVKIGAYFTDAQKQQVKKLNETFTII